MTMGKNDDNGKDDDSKEDGNNGEDDNNDGGNSNSGGSSISAGGSQGNVGCCSLSLVAWCLHTIGIIQICLGINLFWYKFHLACLDMPNRIYSNCIYSRFIPSLFWSKSGSKLFRPILAVTHYLPVLRLRES
jgi:hypothetical protein